MSCFVGLRILCLFGYGNCKVAVAISIRYKIPLMNKINNVRADRKNNSTEDTIHSVSKHSCKQMSAFRGVCREDCRKDYVSGEECKEVIGLLL